MVRARSDGVCQGHAADSRRVEVQTGCMMDAAGCPAAPRGPPWHHRDRRRRIDAIRDGGCHRRVLLLLLDLSLLLRVPEHMKVTRRAHARI